MVKVELNVITAGGTAGWTGGHELVVSASSRRIGKSGAEQTSYEACERSDTVRLLGEKGIRQKFIQIVI